MVVGPRLELFRITQKLWRQNRQSLIYIKKLQIQNPRYSFVISRTSSYFHREAFFRSLEAALFLWLDAKSPYCLFIWYCHFHCSTRTNLVYSFASVIFLLYCNRVSDSCISYSLLSLFSSSLSRCLYLKHQTSIDSGPRIVTRLLFWEETATGLFNWRSAVWIIWVL